MAMKLLRTIVLMTATCLAGVGAQASDALDWEFEVSLDDRKIGYHTFSVAEQDGKRILETEAAFDVKLLFITAFSYRHRNVEVWEDGCLASIDARTDSNGKLFEVKGIRRAERLAIMGTGGDMELSDCVRTFAYWNPELLEAERLLNSQTGEYEMVAIREDGVDTVDVDGTPVEAQRYTLSTERGDIRLWYSRDGLWLALEAPAKGGRTLRYRALQVPGAVAGNA
jgi:hypothetical protein